MPNYCENSMHIEGPVKELKKFRELFRNNGYVFCFEALCPMPKSLDIPASSEEYYAKIYALYERSKIEKKTLTTEFIRKIDLENKMGLLNTHKKLRADADKRLEALYTENERNFSRYPITHSQCWRLPNSDGTIRTREELLAFGNALIDNLLKYGASTWYDWRINNWGVKWEANCQGQEVEIIDNTIDLFFITAWGPPEGFLEKMIEKFPLLDFVVDAVVEGNGHGRLATKIKKGKKRLVTVYWSYDEYDYGDEE